ncbi:flavodoxin domain-containing protein [Mucilaginibacter sp. BT774]|uniref:flavodoxin domain-containing protein n=1 Tax=Mucilaginibacter sp. BT774 TaxID=3062276 RepID=UPI002676C8ED|nr:flavodoxin domain-containing protein [Mucilaginibacter sp. BT774]MDO3628244.1 flavodoxin domain-containing protein [Mucilaginibacter sp. BT774]
MKGVVIYKGKYGSTAQYAKWMAEALYLPILDVDQYFADVFEEYDTLIIGTPVYFGSMLLKTWFLKNEKALLNKTIKLFVVCGSAGDQVAQDKIVKQNLPADLAKHCEVYFLPGRVDMSRLSWFHRLMIKVGALMQKDRQKRYVMQRGYDAVKREHINPLIKSVLHYSITEKIV